MAILHFEWYAGCSATIVVSPWNDWSPPHDIIQQRNKIDSSEEIRLDDDDDDDLQEDRRTPADTTPTSYRCFTGIDSYGWIWDHGQFRHDYGR